MTKSKKIKKYIDNGGRKVYLKGRKDVVTFTSWTNNYELYWKTRGYSTFCQFKYVDKKRTVKELL